MSSQGSWWRLPLQVAAGIIVAGLIIGLVGGTVARR